MPTQLRHVFRSILACLIFLPMLRADDATTATPKAPRSLQGGQVKVLFDSQSLDGWRGRDDLWSVEDGMIVGRTTETDPIDANTFLILNEEITGDFELTLQFKIEGGNSGIQYHSRVLDEEKFIVSGYQADIDATNKFSGILYEEKGRGILALRGQSVTIKPAATVTDKPASPNNKKVGKKKPKVIKDVEAFASADDLAKGIHPGKWNDYRIVVRGNQLEHFINEAMTSKTVDQDTASASDSGVIALQLHRGPAMTIRFKNITIRQWN